MLYKWKHSLGERPKILLGSYLRMFIPNTFSVAWKPHSWDSVVLIVLIMENERSEVCLFSAKNFAAIWYILISLDKFIDIFYTSIQESHKHREWSVMDSFLSQDKCFTVGKWRRTFIIFYRCSTFFDLFKAFVSLHFLLLLHQQWFSQQLSKKSQIFAEFETNFNAHCLFFYFIHLEIAKHCP